MIALIDYGAGNLTSVRKGFAAVGAALYSPRTPADLDAATALVVPGVGHFSATAILDDRWRLAITERIRCGTAVLGICLGMQWLYEGSDEAADVAGLGVIAGRCTRLAAARPLKVPHVGWNGLTHARASRLLDGIADGAHMYFTHTFAAPVTVDTTATTAHGEQFAACVERGRIYGVQFHPEKSSEAGLQILRNFVRLAQR